MDNNKQDSVAVLPVMDAQRATFFLERFKREEKMLGPNEQAALDFTIAALQSQQEIQIVPDRLEDFRSRLIDLFYRHAQLGIDDDAALADKVIEQLEYAAPPSAVSAASTGPGEISHTTEDDYRHFLAYSGLAHSPVLQYTYHHGADVGMDKPAAGEGNGNG